MPLEISKTPGNYFRVYQRKRMIAIPISPREFLNKKNARTWIKDNIRRGDLFDRDGSFALLHELQENNTTFILRLRAQSSMQ